MSRESDDAYSEQSERSEEDEDHLKCSTQKLLIPAGQGFTVPVPVAGGESVEFSFTTKDYDIVFGVARVDAEGSRISIEPARRVPSHERVITGAVDVPSGVRGSAPQALLLEFDNGYSWMTSKELTLTIDVALPPGRFDGVASEKLQLARSELRHAKSAAREYAETLRDASAELEEADRLLAEAQRRRAVVAGTLREAREAEKRSREVLSLCRASHAYAAWRAMGPRARYLVLAFSGPAAAVRWTGVSKGFVGDAGDEGVWSALAVDWLANEDDEEGRQEIAEAAAAEAGSESYPDAARFPPPVRVDEEGKVHWRVAPFGADNKAARRLRHSLVQALHASYGPQQQEEENNVQE